MPNWNRYNPANNVAVPCVDDPAQWPVVNGNGMILTARISTVNAGRSVRFEVRDAQTGQSLVNTLVGVYSDPTDFRLPLESLQEAGRYTWRARAEDSTGVSA
ncbi:hypothetical protein [Kitasatospora herbaricolor]|uniref:hypothetical protein n=1 Tax=Kitasatospora herbaricolor TaxID=68217 RepID=UPI0036DD8421